MVIKHISYDAWVTCVRNRNLQRDKSYNTRPATISKSLNSYNYVIESQTSSFHTLCFPVIVCFPKWEFLNQKIKEDYNYNVYVPSPLIIYCPVIYTLLFSKHVIPTIIIYSHNYKK